MSVVDRLFASIHEAEQRHPLQAPALRIRMGRGAYEAIAESGNPAPSDELERLAIERGGRFRVLYDEALAEHGRRKAHAAEAFGREGSTFLGYPIECDEELEGFEVVDETPTLDPFTEAMLRSASEVATGEALT